MKKGAIIFIAFLSIAATTWVSIYETLEISKEKAKELLLRSIGSGGMQTEMGMVSKARSLPLAARVEGVKEILTLAKEYSKTDEFKKDYKKWRNEKLNPDQKTKLGLPKFGKIINNKIDNGLDKSKNEKLYPSDAQVLIRQRLQDFLVISETVDYNAVVEGGRFVNEEYQKKNPYWKMCYRAGKEVVEAARVIAEEWLAELKAAD